MASTTITAGAAVRVVLVIDNDTGKAIPQPGCQSSPAWQAYLTNGDFLAPYVPVASGPIPPADQAVRCKPIANVPIGETRSSFTTHASYMECADAPDSNPPIPKCLPPPNIAPPLPAGQYIITVDKSPYVGVPKPEPIAAVIVS